MQNDTNNMNALFQIATTFKDVILGFFGGMIAYLIRFQREKEENEEYKFSFVSLFINILLGGYASYLVGSVIDPSWKY